MPQEATQAAPLETPQDVYAFTDMLGKAAQDAGLTLHQLLAIIKKESTFKPEAKRKRPDGKTYDVGLMQISPAAAKDAGYSEEDRTDPLKNIDIGAKYFSVLRDRYKADNLRKLITGYNAGPAALKSGRVPSRTKSYFTFVDKTSKAYGKDPNLVGRDIITLWQNIQSYRGKGENDIASEHIGSSGTTE